MKILQIIIVSCLEWLTCLFLLIMVEFKGTIQPRLNKWYSFFLLWKNYLPKGCNVQMSLCFTLTWDSMSHNGRWQGLWWPECVQLPPPLRKDHLSGLSLRAGPGIFPGYYECGSGLLLLKNKRKIEPNKIPSCLLSPPTCCVYPATWNLSDNPDLLPAFQQFLLYLKFASLLTLMCLPVSDWYQKLPLPTTYF